MLDSGGTVALVADTDLYPMQEEDASRGVRGGGWWLLGPTDPGGLDVDWQLASVVRTKLLVTVGLSKTLASCASLDTE